MQLSGIARKDKILGWKMVVPAILIMIFIGIYPHISILYHSFHDWNIVISGDRINFTGMQNFLRALGNEELLLSVLRTFLFVAIILPAEFVIGLILALMINHRDLRLKGLFRSLLLLPMMPSPVATSVVWNMIYSTQFGSLNYLLQVLGVTDGRTEWLGDLSLAYPALTVATIWMWFPFSVLVLSAALQEIPEEEYEAAHIDGASYGQIFRYITFAHLIPSIMVIILIRFIDGLKTFALVYTPTKGGPGTSTELIYFHIYEVAFRTFNIGYSAAMSVLLVFVTLLGSLFVIRLGRATPS